MRRIWRILRPYRRTGCAQEVDGTTEVALYRPSGLGCRPSHGRLDLRNRPAAACVGGDHGDPRDVAHYRGLQTGVRQPKGRFDWAFQPRLALAPPRLRDRPRVLARSFARRGTGPAR